jgi:hypothetical protein
MELPLSIRKMKEKYHDKNKIQGVLYEAVNVMKNIKK